MVLKLYGVPKSTATKRAALVLHEKNIPFEFHVVDVAKGAHKTPEYLEKQPFGQIPYLDDDGFVVWESRAIARYIQAKWPAQAIALAPPASEVQALARFEQAAAAEQANFDAHLFAALLEKRFKSGPVNEEAVAAALTALEGRLDGYERILAKQRYLAGDSITLADLFHLPHGVLAPSIGFHGLESNKRPNVARWWKDISSRPAWLVIKDEAKGLEA